MITADLDVPLSPHLLRWLQDRFGNDLAVVLAALELAEIDHGDRLPVELRSALAASRRMADALRWLNAGAT